MFINVQHVQNLIKQFASSGLLLNLIQDGLVLINMVTLLMMSAKITTPGLLKISLF